MRVVITGSRYIVSGLLVEQVIEASGLWVDMTEIVTLGPKQGVTTIAMAYGQARDIQVMCARDVTVAARYGDALLSVIDREDLVTRLLSQAMNGKPVLIFNTLTKSYTSTY